MKSTLFPKCGLPRWPWPPRLTHVLFSSYRHAAQVGSVGFNYLFTISQLEHFAMSCTVVTRVLHCMPSFKLLAGDNSQRPRPKMSNRSALHPRGFVCYHRCKMPALFEIEPFNDRRTSSQRTGLASLPSRNCTKPFRALSLSKSVPAMI